MKDLKEPLLPKEENLEEPKQTTLKKLDPSKAWLGYLFTFLAVFQVCLQQLLSKLIFNRHPDITPLQLLLLRSILTSIMFLILMNKKTGYYMLDPALKQHRCSLATRIVQSLFILVFLYTALKYLPLVVVALVQNLSPLFIALFSFFLLKVSLSKLDLCVLLITFIGIILLVTGSIEKEKEESAGADGTEERSIVIPIVCLLFVPVFMAYNVIILRSMREMSEYTIGSYISFSIMIAYAPIIYFSGQGFGYISDLLMLDYLIFFCQAFTGTFLLICRIKSFQYEEPAKLAVLNYFQSIIQFFFDVFLLDATFTFQQILGIAIVFAANSVKWGISIQKVFRKKQLGDTVDNKVELQKML